MSITRIEGVTSMGELEDTDPRPGKVTFLEVTLGGNVAGGVELLYSQIEHYSFLPAGTVMPDGTVLAADETIETIVADVLARTKPANWAAPTNYAPRRSRLSISNKTARYIVFILEGNCQFADGQVPFKVAKDKDEIYNEARCVWLDDQGEPHITMTPPPGIDAKVGYFIAFSDKDNSGVPAAFNIYLDLKFPDGSLIPITVDPDVGYPGGNR